MLKKITLAMTLLLLAINGCVTPSDTPNETYQAWSSSSVGCSPSAIAVSDVEGSSECGATHTWKATCQEKTYSCSNATGKGDICLNNIRCVEAK